MDINTAFPSKYVKSSDLQGREAKVVMARIEYEKIGEDNKIVLYCRGKDKGIVLNKTNASAIADDYGSDTDDWIGKSIILFSAKVEYQGRRVDGIRIRVPREQVDYAPAPVQASPAPMALQAARPAPAPARAPTAEFIDDEIPF